MGKLLLTTFLVFLFISSAPFAQQEGVPEDQLYMLHWDAIKVDMVDKYEENVKKEIDLWKKYNIDMEVSFCSQTDDNEFYYLTPLNGKGDLDKMDDVWGKFMESAGEEYANVNKNYEGVYDFHKNTVWRWIADLSYMPENRRVPVEDIKFIHWDHYYVKEGKQDEAEKLMKEYKDLIAKNNVPDPFNVWVCEIGGDIGWYVFTRSAESTVGFYTQTKTYNEEMGEEFNKLWEQFAPLLKKFTHKNGTTRPELTYKPAK